MQIHGIWMNILFSLFHVQRKGVQMEENEVVEHNSKKRDSSGKMIFEDPILCAQFVRGYTDMPIFQNVQPEDIENVSNRFICLPLLNISRVLIIM